MQSKLITLTAAAILAGGANLAVAATPQQQSGAMQGHRYLRPHHQSIAPAARSGPFARAGERELGEAGAGQIVPERTRLRELMRDIPRLSNIGGTDMRIDGFVTRDVRQAAALLPADVRRMHPRFRNHRAFLYHDQVAILNPRTSRIVALIKIPT